MFLKKLGNMIVVTMLMLFVRVSIAFADGPLEVSKDFSDQVIDIVKGPVIKVLAAVVLLVGVAGLLQGKHKLAVSCGAAFLLLLFLPILLERV